MLQGAALRSVERQTETEQSAQDAATEPGLKLAEKRAQSALGRRRSLPAFCPYSKCR